MPAAAIAAVGFFWIARATASANVIRAIFTGGAGAAGVWPCTDAVMAMEQARASAGLKTCATATFTAGLKTCATAILPVRAATEALHDHIQHGDEQQVQKRRRDHAADDRRPDRMARFLAGAAGDDERH